MAAVGLTDVFKYGSKFLGYLVVVTVVGGGLFVGGAYLASTGGHTLTDPSVSSLTTARGGGGTALALVGTVVALAGTFGLAHKFFADAAMVGIESSAAVRTSAAAATTADGETGADDGDSGESESPPEEPPYPAEGAVEESTEDESTEPEVDEPESPDQAPPTDGQEPGPARDGDVPPASPPVEASAPVDERATDRDRAVPSADPGAEPATPSTEADESGVKNAEPVDSGVDVPATEAPPDESAGDEWTETEYEQASESVESDPATEVPESSSDPVDDAVEEYETEPQEWTPPDPSEFEQPDDGGESAQTDGTDADGDAEWDEPDTSTVDEGRTWDDVQSGSDRTERDDGLTGGRDPGEQSTDQISGDSTPVDDTVEYGEDQSNGDIEESPEDVPDDRTLADEGVGSFDTNSDDDPLADALSDE